MNRRSRIEHYRNQARAAQYRADLERRRQLWAELDSDPDAAEYGEEVALYRSNAACYRARARALTIRPYLIVAAISAACLVAALLAAGVLP